MTPALSFDPRTVTPDWVRQAVQRFTVPVRFQLRVTHWRATGFLVAVPNKASAIKARWRRAFYARNKAAGLTAHGTLRLRRQHPELRGLPWRQYHTAWTAKRRAELRGKQSPVLLQMPTNTGNCRPGPLARAVSA